MGGDGGVAGPVWGFHEAARGNELVPEEGGAGTDAPAGTRGGECCQVVGVREGGFTETETGLRVRTHRTTHVKLGGEGRERDLGLNIFQYMLFVILQFFFVCFFFFFCVFLGCFQANFTCMCLTLGSKQEHAVCKKVGVVSVGRVFFPQF